MANHDKPKKKKPEREGGPLVWVEYVALGRSPASPASPASCWTLQDRCRVYAFVYLDDGYYWKSLTLQGAGRVIRRAQIAEAKRAVEKIFEGW